MDFVYADYNATYPASDLHLDTLTRIIKQSQGNPSSIHMLGRQAKLHLEEARERVAALFGSERYHIIFTAGATEANNLALQGVLTRCAAASPAKPPPKILLSAGEHSSLRRPAEWLAAKGSCRLEYLPLKASGVVDEQALFAALSPDCVFVGLIHANNETGAINPIESLSVEIKKRCPSVHLHVDAVQAVGKLPSRWVASSPIDSLAASAHKIGGLKGVGCLYRHPEARLEAMVWGGGQEHRLRSGTENMAGIISFGLRAMEISANPDWLSPMQATSAYFIAELGKLSRVQLHGDRAFCLANTVNFHVEGVGGDRLMLQFDRAHIAVSSGSACASGVGQPSPVLLGMGYSEWVALNSIRVSFGAGSTVEEADRILAVLRQVVNL